MAFLRLFNLYLSGLKHIFLSSFFTLMDLWQQSSLKPRAGFGGREEKESGEKAELSTESAESSCSHILPSVFPTHRYFPLLSIVSKIK